MTRNLFLCAALAAATTAGCAVKLNGKTFGTGGGGSTSSGGGAPAARTDGPTSTVIAPGGGDADAPPANAREVAYNEAKTRKPPAQPADPWAAVEGDQPKVFRAPRYYFHSETKNDCTAAHDHCLQPHVWFLEQTAAMKDLYRTFAVATYGGIDPADEYDDELWDGWGREVGMSDDRVTAYRTVPATKRHLVKGALAISQPYPATSPQSESDASGGWVGGTVESIDWAAGKLRLVGHREVYWISATRVAVLVYAPGGKVEIKGKLGKGELAVKPTEVIQPKVDQGSVADPWAEVGKDGQPKEPTDSVKLETTRSVTCDAAHDHCLRPWVWFVEEHKGARPSRFKSGEMHAVFDVDNLVPHGSKDAAYRTVPVAPEQVKEGMHVFFLDGLPDSESDANSDYWMFGDVSEVQVEAGVFKVKGSDRHYPLDTVRAPVVMWFPGEKAEKYE